MKHLAAAVGLVVLLACAAAAAPSGNDPEKVKQLVAALDADPARVNALCQRFKDNPWAQDAMSIGSALTIYMMETEKVSVKVGEKVLPSIIKDKSDVNFRLLVLYDNGLLRYALQHGGKADDTDEAAAVAGLTEMAEGYANMLKAKPDEKNAVADQVLEAYGAGNLPEFFKACQK